MPPFIHACGVKIGPILEVTVLHWITEKSSDDLLSLEIFVIFEIDETPQEWTFFNIAEMVMLVWIAWSKGLRWATKFV